VNWLRGGKPTVSWSIAVTMASLWVEIGSAPGGRGRRVKNGRLYGVEGVGCCGAPEVGLWSCQDKARSASRGSVPSCRAGKRIQIADTNRAAPPRNEMRLSELMGNSPFCGLGRCFCTQCMEYSDCGRTGHPSCSLRSVRGTLHGTTAFGRSSSSTWRPVGPSIEVGKGASATLTRP
jgi:hypothetical protein